MTNEHKEEIKNLVTQKTTYIKHNSFDNFKSSHMNDTRYIGVLENLKKLEGELHIIDDEYKRNILQRVFNDLNKTNEKSFAVFCLYQNVLEDLLTIDYDQYPRYLFYRYRYEIFPHTKELDDFPPCLQIEPTSICNFRCIFCYQTDEQFTDMKGTHMGNMEFELFKKIVDEAQGKVEAITLASRGEPTVHKDLGKMLDYLDGKFLATKMNTNASILNEKKCHDILKTNLHTLVFSADAAEEPLYSKLRVNGKLETTLKNIKLFNKIKKEHYPNSKLITRVSGVKVNQKQNIDDMDKLWGDLVDQVAFVNYNPWENTYERPTNDISTPCSDLWRRAFVWFDGRVNPCDVDYKSELCVGNVKENSLSEIWTKGGYKTMREKHLNKKRSDIHPCNKCTFL